MRGRLAALSCVLFFVAAAPALAGDPIMPLSELREGMHCTAYSVVRGTDIASFDAEILDVVDDTSGEGARILVRVSGPAVDATGIGPGFSGSPIYCPAQDGTPKNAGAISESIGEYGGKVALATPIEAVLAVPVSAPAPRTGNSRAAQIHGPAKPLSTPVSISGVNPALGRALTRAAAAHGRTLLSAPALPLRPFPVQDLKPGSAVSVGLSGGDINIGAIGTVAYTDADRVWAFGHPFDGVGGRSLLLQDAYVYRVINNPNQSGEQGGTYKLATAGHTVGTLTDDASDAVAGVKNVLPPVITVHAVATDTDTGRRDAVNVQVPDETDLGNPAGGSALAFVGPTAIIQAAAKAIGSAPPKASGRACFRIVLREAPKRVRVCNRYVASGEEGVIPGIGTLVAARAAEDLSQMLSLVDEYKLGKIHVRSVDVDLEVGRGVKQAYLLDAKLPRTVRRGSRVTAKVRLRRRGGGSLRRSYTVRVPHGIGPGPHHFVLVGEDSDAASGDLLGELTLTIGGEDDTSGDPGTRSVAALVREMRAVQRYDGVRLHVGRLSLHAFRDPDLRISGRASADVFVR